MFKKAVATGAAIAVIGGAGFAAGQATSGPATADAAARKGQSGVVRQLKTLNRNVRAINKGIGNSTYSSGSVRAYLREIEDHTSETCHVLGGLSSRCR